MSKFDYYDIDPKTGIYRNIADNSSALPKKEESNFYVKSPDNEVGTVPFSKVGEALGYGYTPVNDKVRVRFSEDGDTGYIPSDKLQEALGYGLEIDGPNLGDYGQAAVQGVAKGVGNLADIGVAAGSYLQSKNPLQKAVKAGADALGVGELIPNTEQLQDQAKDYWKNPKLEQVASDYFQNNITTSGLEATKTAGEFVGGIPEFKAVQGTVKVLTSAGKIANLPWVKNLNKFLDVPLGDPKTAAKTGAGFAGAGAGSSLAQEEGAGEWENLTRSLLGGIAGGVVVQQYGSKALKAGSDYVMSLPKKITNIPQAIKELPDAVKASILKPFGSEVDRAGFDAFKEAGIEPTPEMILANNKVASWLGKQRSAVADKIIENANEKSLESIEKSLDKHLGEYIGRNESNFESAAKRASNEFKGKAEEELSKLNEISNQKYNEAYELLNEEQWPTATNTIKALEEQLKRVKAPSTAGSSDSGQGLVATALGQIKQAWQGGKVAPWEMIAQEKALNEMSRTYNTKSYAKSLKPIREAIEKDLEEVGNKEFVEKYRAAKQFFATEIVPYTKTDIARSIMEGKTPELAYAFTSSSDGIASLKEMTARHPEGEKLVNMLLRAKAQEKIIEGFSKNGMFKGNKFIESFNNSKSDQYLLDLLGPAYKDVKGKGTVLGEALERTSKAMSNPSGTAGSLTAAAGVYKSTKGILTGNPKDLLEGLGIQLLPKMLANTLLTPGAASQLVKAAEKGNDQTFMRILTRSIKDFPKDAYNTPAARSVALKTGAQIMPYAVDNPLMDDYYKQIDQTSPK